MIGITALEAEVFHTKQGENKIVVHCMRHDGVGLCYEYINIYFNAAHLKFYKYYATFLICGK